MLYVGPNFDGEQIAVRNAGKHTVTVTCTSSFHHRSQFYWILYYNLSMKQKQFKIPHVKNGKNKIYYLREQQILKKGKFNSFMIWEINATADS